MDSKRSMPSPQQEGAAPPAYIETLNTTSTTSKLDPPKYIPSSIPVSALYSHQIQDQLHSITSQINSLQTLKSLLSHAQDEKILSILTNEIQTFLSSFANSGLQKGSLILVPRNSVQDVNTMPTNFDLRKEEEYDRIVRVSDKEAAGLGDGGMWYWHDEDMAKRLADYLRPPPDPRAAELPPRKEEVTPSSGKSFWGRKKTVKSPVESKKGKMPTESLADRVEIKVNAEEVVFRLENDFGVLETERGWGVVLTFKVILARR